MSPNIRIPDPGASLLLLPAGLGLSFSAKRRGEPHALIASSSEPTSEESPPSFFSFRRLASAFLGLSLLVCAGSGFLFWKAKHGEQREEAKEKEAFSALENLLTRSFQDKDRLASQRYLALFERLEPTKAASEAWKSKTAKLPPAPPEESFRLDLESEPSGASVNVGGQNQGTTPLSLHFCKSDPLKIKLSRKDYEDVEWEWKPSKVREEKTLRLDPTPP